MINTVCDEMCLPPTDMLYGSAYEFLETGIEGQALFNLPFGDIVNFLTPYTAVLFIFALTFTIIAVISKPERQVDTVFGGDACYTKDIPQDTLRFQRFMAIACGLATMGGIMAGDVFNFTLFTAFIGITNIGIVAAVKNKHILDNAFEYGLLAMIGTLPLFVGAALVREIFAMYIDGRKMGKAGKFSNISHTVTGSLTGAETAGADIHGISTMLYCLNPALQVLGG